VDDWYSNRISEDERRAVSAAIWREAKDAGLDDEVIRLWREWNAEAVRS